MEIGIITIVLGLLGKAGITFAGREITKTFWEDIKDKIGLNKTNAEKLGNAFFNASMKSKETNESIDSLIVSFEEDEYYKLLLFGLEDIDNKQELTPYLKHQSKLFLIEIFKDEQLRAYFFNEKLDLIFQNISTVQEDLSEVLLILKAQLPQKLSNYPINKFVGNLEDFPEYYIPRSLSVGEDFFSTIYNLKDLFERRQNKDKPLRTIILADGGSGKSTLLKDWSLKLYELYPVSISLRDYVTSDSLDEYIFRRYGELRNVGKSEYKNICFLIDGFDEVQDINTSIRRINDFCNVHDESHVIITSRSNAYSEELEKFDKYYLNDIEQHNIEYYITKKYSTEIAFSDFWNEITKNNFQNMVFSPFYLNILIKCYIENGHQLNISKKALIDRILDERKDKDREKRPDWRIDRPMEKKLISEKRERIAFIMALMNQRYLLETDILSILGYEKEIDFYIGTLPIKKGQSYDKNPVWEFEHNIFLEHIVSTKLIGLDFNKIIELTTVENKVKPKWIDIITHLLGILDINNPKEKELLDSLVLWLQENDAGVLIKIESTQLSQDVKNDVFWKIFQSYQDKKIWIDSYGIRREQWALFSENKENIYKVFDEIKNVNKPIQNIQNAVLLFSLYSFKDLSPDETEALAREYIENLKESPLQFEDLIHDLVYAFPFTNNNCLDVIIKQFKSSDFHKVRGAIYHLIYKYQLQDKYIDILLEAIKENEQNRHSGSYDTETSIELCLFSLKEIGSYVKFFNFLYENEDIYYSFRGSRPDSALMRIVKNSTNNYTIELLDIIIELSSKHESWGGGYWDYYTPFFLEKNIREDAVERLLNTYLVEGCDEHNFENYICTLALILKEADLEKVTNKMDSIDFYETLHRCCWEKIYIQEKIQQHLLSKYNYTMPPPPVNPWVERKNAEFDILFNKEQFEKESLAIYKVLDTDIINPKQLLVDNHRRNREIGNYWNLTIIQILRRKFDDDEVSRDALIQWFQQNNKDVEDYLHREIFDRIKSRDGLKRLNERQILYIIDWYTSRIEEVDFDVKFRKSSNGGFSKEKYDERIPILLFYMHNLKLDISDDNLCKQLCNPLIISQYNQFALPFEDESISINTIQRKIQDKSVLKKYIKLILEDYKSQFDTTLNLVSSYVIENHLVEFYQLIINMLKNPDFSKKHIIEDWLKHNLSPKELLSIKNNFSQQEQIFLADQLIQQDKNMGDAKVILDSIPLEAMNEADFLEILVLQIKCGDLDALKKFVKHSKDKQFIGLEKYPERDIMAMLKYQSNYLKYSNIEALSTLMEYMKLCYDLGQVQFVPQIIDNIKNLALQNEENYYSVIKILESFAKKCVSPYLAIQNINYGIESIKQAYLEMQSNSFDYKKAKRVYEELF
jgi:hypothetical protein